MRIEVKNIVRYFGSKRAVSDLSFNFESGNIFGFIGPNGAGKTTTIKIMSSLDMPDIGDVLYDGLSVVNYPEQVRRIIGYMPDSLPAFKDIQVWEYLDFFARSFKIKGATRRRRLAELEEFTGLGEIRMQFLNTLSKGQKQRVSLARALVHNPEVLIMDEPAAGLDPRARVELRNLLKVLSNQGKAILLSSHILSELQDICDGAVIIDQGKLLGAGTLDELLRNNFKSGIERSKEFGTSETPTLQDAIERPDQLQNDDLFFTVIVSEQINEVRLELLTNPAILDANIVANDKIECRMNGDDSSLRRIMSALLAKDLPICGFDKTKVDLEALFMKMTGKSDK